VTSFRRNVARSWLLRIAVVWSLVAAAGFALLIAAPTLVASFLDVPPLNVALNLVIVAAFLVGLFMTVAWLVRAVRQEGQINQFVRTNFGDAPGRRRTTWSLDGIGRSAMRERAELLAELQKSGSSYDAGSLADALLDREEPRVAVARYTSGMLVLLGLLGTFVGLLITISGVSDVVDGLAIPASGDIEGFLLPLQAGLRTPLRGMTVAFSTSLLGLAGSLILGAGALALQAAQAAWIGKLEQATALYLVPASGVLAASGGTGVAAPSTGLARVEMAARYLREAQAALGEHVARVDAAGERMATTLGDFSDRVAALGGQFERVESVLARLADEQGAGRQALNDIGVKLADLYGAAAVVKADVRDGQRELVSELRGATRSLNDGTSGALSGLAQIMANSSGTQEIGEIVAELRADLQRAATERRGETQAVLEELRRIGQALGARRSPPPGAAR